MYHVKCQPWWKVRVTGTPGAATLIGIAISSMLGGLVAFSGLDRTDPGLNPKPREEKHRVGSRPRRKLPWN
jgi:hypothetical protein